MKKLVLVGAALMGVALTGCAVGNGYAAVRFGPPPPPRYGVMGYAPGSGFVWTEGSWDWRGGRWLRPPHARAVWVAGYWREDHHQWRFERGHWR